MQSLVQRTKAFLTPNSSSANLAKSAQQGSDTNQYIFPCVSPSIDGPDCFEDCSTCTIHYPPKFSIDESDQLYAKINGWSTHLLIATGKSDWVRDIADEKGSLMEAVGRYGTKLKNGKVMVSACNIPVPEYECQDGEEKNTITNHGKDLHKGSEKGKEKGETQVLVLPAWEIVERVPPSRVAEFMEGYVARANTTETPITSTTSPSLSTRDEAIPHPQPEHSQPDDIAPPPQPPSQSSPLPPSPSPPPSFPFPTHPCPHTTLILLCSQRTRDARCGQSAPLLRREFERHLRPLGLYRDLHDQRPGGVGIYFISHVGGHKYSANVIVYRRERSVLPSSGGAEEGREGNGGDEEEHAGEMGEGVEADGMVTQATTTANEAVQCIWLARVRPEDCEGIVKYTVLQGKVVKPERQLRGGFDRSRGVTSWEKISYDDIRGYGMGNGVATRLGSLMTDA